MPNRHYFLKEDLEALNESIRDIDDRIRDILQQAGGSCQEGADTWHDNFEYEESQRGASMWSNRLRELVSLRASAHLIIPSLTGDEVLIGRTVTVEDEITKEKSTFQIGSYMALKKRTGQEVVSYAAPLASILIGAKVGESREGKVGGEIKKFKVIKIK
ncbi:MAG: GreA/GreB family elongation factor [bacterium]